MSIVFVIPKNMCKTKDLDLILKITKYKNWKLIIEPTITKWENNKVYLVEKLVDLRDDSFKNVKLVVNDAEDYEYLYFYQPHIKIDFIDDELEDSLIEEGFLPGSSESFKMNI